METKSKYERVKEHVKKHKEAYISGSVCLIVGSMTALFIARRSPVMPALGDPGNVVQEVETGLTYPSQGQYARAHGVSATQVSQHLKGDAPDLKGKHLRVIGKAHPIEE